MRTAIAQRNEHMRAVELRQALVVLLAVWVRARHTVHLVLRRVVDGLGELIISQNCQSLGEAPLDMKIRETLLKNLKQAAVSKIIIERPLKKCRVTVHTAKPGVVIGKKGADIEKLRAARLALCAAWL